LECLFTHFSQIRSQAAPITRPQSQTSIQIRPTQNTTSVRAQKAQPTSLPNSVQVTKTQASTGAQLKQVVTNNNVNINNNNTKNNNNNNKNQVSIAVVSSISSTQVANNSKSSTTSPNKSPGTKSNAISNSSHSSTITTTPTKSPTIFNNNKTHHEKKSQGSAIKAKDKKTSLASVVAATASSGNNSNAMSNFYPTFGDDDINDVAAMGGVNLAEESQKILGSTEFVGTQIRSCKDEVLLNLPILQQRIRQQMARHGLDEPSTDIAVLISHATQGHLKNIVEKLAVIAEHRIDILKVRNHHYYQ
jgi:transcription initiation factor TFIID subunit 4